MYMAFFICSVINSSGIFFCFRFQIVFDGHAHYLVIFLMGNIWIFFFCMDVVKSIFNVVVKERGPIQILWPKHGLKGCR